MNERAEGGDDENKHLLTHEISLRDSRERIKAEKEDFTGLFHRARAKQQK